MRSQPFLFIAIIAFLTVGCGEQTESETTARKKPPIVKKQINWMQSYDKAISEAEKQDKLVFAFFTGSDWCRYCTLLDHQILSSPEFASWSKDKVVLLQLDFPKDKAIAPELKEQNNQLMSRYRVTGFPTVILLTAKGEPVLRVGYEPISAEEWISAVDAKLLELNPTPTP